MPKERIIIGIDPGTTVMGYGVLKINGNKPELITLGILQLNKFDNHYMKLRRIFERVLGLIDQYHRMRWLSNRLFSERTSNLC